MDGHTDNFDIKSMDLGRKLLKHFHLTGSS